MAAKRAFFRYCSVPRGKLMVNCPTEVQSINLGGRSLDGIFRKLQSREDVQQSSTWNSRREYYWRKMYHVVYEYVRGCDQCQRFKVAKIRSTTSNGFLSHWETQDCGRERLHGVPSQKARIQDLDGLQRPFRTMYRSEAAKESRLKVNSASVQEVDPIPLGDSQIFSVRQWYGIYEQDRWWRVSEIRGLLR